MAQTPSTEDLYEGDGVRTVFPLTFPYLSQDEVFVAVDDVNTPYVWVGGSTASVQLAVAPVLGAEVKVYRNTKAFVPLHVFAGGVPFLPRYIDENNRQLLYVSQEAINSTAGTAAEALVVAEEAKEIAERAETKVDTAIIDSSYQLRLDLANTDGGALVSQNGLTFKERLVGWLDVREAPYNFKGDGTSQDRLNLIAAMDAGAAAGRLVVIPPGVWDVGGWLPLPDKLQLWGVGATLRLTSGTGSMGGFVVGGYDLAVTPRAFTNATIFGLDLDCNNLPGENGWNSVTGTGVRFINVGIKNTVHTLANLGGRAFQFEGATVDGIHVIAPRIRDCSIGINSHADAAAGTHKVINVLYSDVTMTNVDVPFNIDGQYPNPAAGQAVNMSTTVRGALLYNCGKLRMVGATSTAGGIICGDRGYGLSVTGLRLVNTLTYGGIGGLVRGKVFGVHMDDWVVDVPSATALVDFNPVGIGAPSSAEFACSLSMQHIRFKGNLDYVIKSPTVGNVGNVSIEVALDGAAATLAVLIEPTAASTTGFLDVSLSDSPGRRTGLRSMSELVARGNTTALCVPMYSEGTWTPADSSGAGLVYTSATGRWVRKGNEITLTWSIVYPTTTSNAQAAIGNLPMPAVSSAYGGIVCFPVGPTQAGIGRLIAGSIVIYTSARAGCTNANLSGQTLEGSAIYLAG